MSKNHSSGDTIKSYQLLFEANCIGCKIKKSDHGYLCGECKAALKAGRLIDKLLKKKEHVLLQLDSSGYDNAGMPQYFVSIDVSKTKEANFKHLSRGDSLLEAIEGKRK